MYIMRRSHYISSLDLALFQQAIIESGSELVIWGLNPPESDPQNYTYELAKNLNCERLTDELMMDCLRALPWRDVVDGQIGRCAVSNYGCMDCISVCKYTWHMLT